ncbi:hypothetical protein [Thiocapsa marina]|uniref:Transposase IS4 family protein n=1 Tax=Thiocapsa marina 5811 TaxID=768671 RepID=F9U651_9GAMM|nr:hypothetical protein [Thiocapsa marina]EGV20624.1 hypothetical protein ThimaDRAFT_0402 [Thiocapsa marina 5811]
MPWILDADVTVKPLYGHQEGAVKGYNPHKPGRPSHTDHIYFVAGLRLILDVEVLDGNQTASKYSVPGLWELLARLPRGHWPLCIRADAENPFDELKIHWGWAASPPKTSSAAASWHASPR